jgi:hypothetical protein
LNEKQRDHLIKAMLMEPFFKGQITKIFPAYTNKTAMMGRCRKELENELLAVITRRRQGNIQGIQGQRPMSVRPTTIKEKDRSDIDIFAYLAPEEPTTTENTSIARDPEVKWIQDYLKNDQSIGSIASGTQFWLDNRIKYPSCYEIVLKYRSFLCTSIYEEQLFSNVRKIVTDDRGSLKDETIDEMFFFKKNQDFVFPYDTNPPNRVNKSVNK